MTDNELHLTKQGPGGQIFAPLYIGWCDTRVTEFYPERTFYVRATQTDLDGRSSEAVLVTQQENKVFFAGNYVYFQQGRKDPIIGVEAKANASQDSKTGYPEEGNPYLPDVMTAASTMPNMIQHPYMYYATEDTGWVFINSWNAARPTSNFSASTPIVKSVYDPSPTGFKVPNQAAIEAFKLQNTTWETRNNNTGRLYEPSDLFLPAIGRVHGLTGIRDRVGVNIYFTCGMSNGRNNYWIKTMTRFTDGSGGSSAKYALPVMPVIDD